MDVLENVERGLSVAFTRRLVQHLGHLGLALGAALLFGIFRDGVELYQSAILLRRQPSRISQRVALQAFFGGEIDTLKDGFGRFNLARFIR